MRLRVEPGFARILPILDQVVVATLLRKVPFWLELVEPLYPPHSCDLHVCKTEKRLVQVAEAVISVVVRIANGTEPIAEVRLSNMVLETLLA